MSTEIYYFSGTGNSLRVAQELQANLSGAEMIPMAHLLHEGVIFTHAETVGFVFPNFCLTIPIVLHDFLLKVNLASAKYIFAVCTRGGSESDAFDYINEILNAQGKRLDACLNVTMPWNHPIGKENLIGRDTEERRIQLESTMLVKVADFSQRILQHKPYSPQDTDVDFPIPPLMKWVFSTLVSRSANYRLHEYFYQDKIRFYANASCGGCGTCEKVCISQRIEMVDQKPVWKKGMKCYACFACINYCPNQAIQVEKNFLVDSRTEENPRYRHPSVSFKEIAKQR